jgi:hypothetical protein
MEQEMPVKARERSILPQYFVAHLLQPFAAWLKK